MSSSTDRLAKAVMARRLHLGLTHDGVKAAGGPSDTTVSKIENNTAGEPARLTLERLDKALRWESGSARSVLDGGDPTPLAEEPVGLDGYSSVDLARELLRRLTEGADGHGQQPAPITTAHAEQVLLPEPSEPARELRGSDDG